MDKITIFILDFLHGFVGMALLTWGFLFKNTELKGQTLEDFYNENYKWLEKIFYPRLKKEERF